MDKKLKELSKYSDPSKVLKNMKKYQVEGDLFISNRRDKKYYILHEGRKVHFGQMGYKDFTLTNDLRKKEAFQERNHKWKDAPKYTPRWCSWYLLW